VNIGDTPMTLTDTKEDKEEPLIDAQRRWGLRD
jgi:hypothetical protein